MSDDDSYRGVPGDIVIEVGKIAIAGSALEEAVYRMAEALDLKQPRSNSGTGAAKEIRKAVAQHGLPPWVTTTVSDLDDWLASAIDVLERRNDAIHRTYLSRATDDGWVQHGQRTNRKQPPRPISVEDVVATRDALDRASADGPELWRGLLPRLSTGVYMYYYGPDAGTIVVAYTDGHWPTRPTEEQVDEWYGALTEAYPDFFPTRPGPNDGPDGAA